LPGTYGKKGKTRAGTLFSLLRLLLHLVMLHLVLDGGREAAQGAGRGNRSLQGLEFPEGNNICDEILET
jgi:hypothetical protein